MVLRVLVSAELKDGGNVKAPAGVEVTFYDQSERKIGPDTVEFFRGFDAFVTHDFNTGDENEDVGCAAGGGYDYGVAHGLGLKTVIVNGTQDTSRYSCPTAKTLTEALTLLAPPVCLAIGFAESGIFASLVRGKGYVVRVVTGDERLEELEAAVDGAKLFLSYDVDTRDLTPQRIINLSHAVGYAAGKGLRRVIFDPHGRTQYGAGKASIPANVTLTRSLLEMYQCL